MATGGYQRMDDEQKVEVINKTKNQLLNVSLARGGYRRFPPKQ
jgi:hypothetical protein